MFFYNNPYLIPRYNNGGSTFLPKYQDGEEPIYDEHDADYDYKVIDGIWYTRKKGTTGNWISLESNEEATNKLNTAYPDALNDGTQITECECEDGTQSADCCDSDNKDDEYVGPKGKVDNIDDANKIIQKNPGFANPKSGTILDTVGDNPYISLIHAIGTTIKSFGADQYDDPGSAEDYMKYSITNPTDEGMYINPEEFEKNPNKPWNYLEDQEQMVEREFTNYLDERSERSGGKYSKVS